MQFEYKERTVKLVATRGVKNQLPALDKGQSRMGNESTYFIQVSPWQEDRCCYALNLEEVTDVNKEAHALLEEFPELTSEPSGLPPNKTDFDHTIPLVEGANPVSIRPYRYPAMQKTVIEGLIEEMLQKGVIKTSSSPFASPVVLVKKKDGGWRLCIDYRVLNKLTIKNRYPIPLIEDLFDELGGANVFSKLDLKSEYHQIRVHEGDQYKMAFQTHSGHYEFVVMPFGLSNASATFQNAMNYIFKEHLRRFVLVFFDDILIYSKDGRSHVAHLRRVFSILKQCQYIINKGKCVLAASKIEYLGHYISAEGVYTDPKKLEVVEKWPTPRNVKQLRSFLGMTGYYRRFVKGYGGIARLLTDLLKRGDLNGTSKQKKHF